MTSGLSLVQHCLGGAFLGLGSFGCGTLSSTRDLVARVWGYKTIKLALEMLSSCFRFRERACVCRHVHLEYLNLMSLATAQIPATLN